MKRLILAVMFVMFMAGISSAADLVQFQGLNLSGDTLYLTKTGTFAVGAGTNIASLKDIVEIRGVLVSPVNSNESNKAGIGVGINVVKLINKIGGSWLSGNINTSIGITGVTNLDGKVIVEPALYMTVIKIGL